MRIQERSGLRQAVPSTSTFASPSTAAPKRRWVCRFCRKGLSSKRSYEEHMNIHNGTRPFPCDHCDYAASSQMTLRRHKLRQHTPRTDWGYQCPYCVEVYMEPAAYQQHVWRRHPDRSATFRCPQRCCRFRSKCSRQFRDHLAKHENRSRSEQNNASDKLSLINEIHNRKTLPKFLVGNENGCGLIVDMKAPLQLPNSTTFRQRGKDALDPDSVDKMMMQPDECWIEAEVIVESAQLPDGTIDFELD